MQKNAKGSISVCKASRIWVVGEEVVERMETFLLRKNDDNNFVLELVVISEGRAVNGSEEKAVS